MSNLAFVWRCVTLVHGPPPPFIARSPHIVLPRKTHLRRTHARRNFTPTTHARRNSPSLSTATQWAPETPLPRTYQLPFLPERRNAVCGHPKTTSVNVASGPAIGIVFHHSTTTSLASSSSSRRRRRRQRFHRHHHRRRPCGDFRLRGQRRQRRVEVKRSKYVHTRR